MLLSQCIFMGTSSASCSRYNMIFSVPTLVSFLTFNLVLHAVAGETYFDPIVIVFLLQCPPTYTCASSKIYAWFSSYYHNDIWNGHFLQETNFDHCNLPSLIPILSISYLFNCLYGISLSVKVIFFIAYLASFSCLKCGLLMDQSL